MDSEFARYDALVHRIYDAALEPSRWPSVLADIADANGASHSLLFTPMHSPAQGGFLFPHNIPQSALELWAAKGMHEDPLVAAAVARGLIDQGEGIAINGAELVPEDVLLASSFYRDHWEPINIARVCSGMVFDGTDAHKLPTILAVYRRLCDAPFDARQVDLVQRLLAHVSRSLGVMFHLRDSQLQAASTLAALDRLPAGVLLLTNDHCVQFANSAAQRLLKAEDLLRLETAGSVQGLGRLALASRLHRLNGDLQRSLGDALAPVSTRSPTHFSQALVLPDEQGKPSCVLHAAPLGAAPTFRLGAVQPRAIVFLYELAAAASVSPGRLCELFNLTHAEACAALQVLQGGSSEAMAARLGVSINTFKTQLKAAYAKSNTHRQTDFLKLLLALSTA